MFCQQCNKRLSRKTAREKDGKPVCAPCLFGQTCEVCKKPKDGGGFRGPVCQCGVVASHAADRAHSVGTQR